MPYQVKKFSNGWYVVKLSTNEKMSIKPFKTKILATKQMQAIGISEAARKNKYKK